MTKETSHKATRQLGEAVQIVNGKPSLIWVSASLITNADTQSEGGCLRKVWFEKVGGRDKQTSEAMEAGTEMHAEIEHYELTGEHVLKPIASAGRQFIDKVWLEPSLYKVEHPMVHHKDGKITRSWLHADDIPAAGHIDLVNMSGRYIDENGETRRDAADVVEIKDWKSTSDLKWAKTKEQVADTIQMNTYGGWAINFFDMMQNYERVRLTHVYFQRNRPFQAVLRTSIRTAEQIDAKWKYSTSIVRTIKDAINEPVADKVPGNKKACYSYNKPCAHLGVCSIGSFDSLDDIFKKVASDFKLPATEEGTDMGLLDNFNFAQPPVAAPVSAPAPVLPPQPDMRAQLQAEEERLRAQQQAMQAAPPVPMDMKNAWERIQKHGRGTPCIGMQAAAAVAQAYNIPLTAGAAMAGTGELAKITITDPTHIYELLNELESHAAQNGTNPTAAQIVPVQVTVAPPPPPPGPTTVMVGSTPVQMQPPAPAGLLPPDAPALNQATASAGEKPVAAPAEPKKRGPGRPPKAQETTPEAPQAAGEPSTPASAPAIAAPAAASLTTDAPPAARALEVYINCAPMRNVKPLNGYIDAVNAELSRRYCVDDSGKPTIQDIRCAPKNSVLGFGGWKGAVHAIVVENPPADDSYQLMTNGDELAEIVADAMRVVCSRKKAQYVRGIGR